MKIIALAVLACLLLSAGGCTEYERAGVNPKPFNAPAAWERDPYNGRIRN